MWHHPVASILCFFVGLGLLVYFFAFYLLVMIILVFLIGIVWIIAIVKERRDRSYAPRHAGRR